ncbi:uncharacterized protein RCC_00088 [Ramularia collo-cygni]|uniref:Zn(2)-C6 fungal-type domain-containing protein n=1 Tax=Ramularia collo-cygni TaxID=112498 RepID=A0A2D3UVS1_9PEZI|nr:uncharacterized protein RCC_00088 [Ramularia collo-cygni]CZT14114.1 uncharacterized protein RCC_00088 [Ramularia collo-cygni]
MPSSTSASDKNRRSRITAACAVCRAKRQKCSGSKPQCDQCRMHNEECWWSDQKKRGPAKDYLRSLQDRLQETERLLLTVLPHVPDEILGPVLQQSDATSGPSHQAWTSSLSGPEYWSRFSLNRIDHIRDWQDHRASGVLRPSPQSSQPAQNSAQASIPDEMHHPSAHIHQNMLSEHAGQNGGLAGSTPANDGWSQPQPPPARLDERRYSEETRDACEALFSISRPSETKRPEYAPPGQNPQSPYPATTGDRTSLPSQLPKLFW